MELEPTEALHLRLLEYIALDISDQIERSLEWAEICQETKSCGESKSNLVWWLGEFISKLERSFLHSLSRKNYIHFHFVVVVDCDK